MPPVVVTILSDLGKGRKLTLMELVDKGCS